MMAFVLQSGRWFSNHLSPGPCEPKTCGQGKIGDPAVDGQQAKISPHDPEVVGSNPTPATKSEPESVGLWFFIRPAHSGRHFSKNGGISNEPQFAGLANF
jgi:hypothetical protein